MSRRRLIPDPQIFATIVDLAVRQGERAVTFAAIARLCHLAAPSLVQRYGSLTQMLTLAYGAEWDRITTATNSAIAEMAEQSRGPHTLLKSLTPISPSPALLAASQRHAALRDMASAWQSTVIAALADLCGTPAAAILFATWQGQVLWHGDKSFKLKDAVKTLA